MDLDRMLDKCRRLQWSVDDLDWSGAPRELSREHEMAVVQYFLDMSGIERLAGALFAEQRRRVRNPVLKEIFETFEVDEERHAVVAERLARYYDVHHFKSYRMSESLCRFRPHFLAAVRHMPLEIANTYITTGELLLDIALLRSLDDFVDDEMSHRAMDLINRDESRHIAIDFYMIEYYCADRHRLEGDVAKSSLRERLEGWNELGKMLCHAGPFLREVFFEPMDLTDPSGRRMLEAFKRMQLVGRKPEVARRPFSRFLRINQLLFNQPLARKLIGPVLLRLVGLDPRVMRELYTKDEEERARRTSLEQLAEEALAVKYHAGPSSPQAARTASSN
jgi:hypothetical protein